MTDFRALSLKQLRAMASTVRHGSVTGAARDLNVTPPAITTQLKILEGSVGAPLFDRSVDGFVPTDIGREVLDLAIAVEKLIARSDDRIGALKSGASGTVVLGAVSTAKYFVPAIVAAFQAANPGIRVKLVIGNREDIVLGLERSEYDLLIMGRPPAHLDLLSDPLGDHPHVLIAPPGHRLAADTDITPEDLLSERFLAREPGSGTRSLMDRFLDRLWQSQRFEVVEMGTNETIKQAVMAGLGIALISAHTCLAELREGKLAALPVVGLPLVRQWFLIRRVDHRLTKAAEVFRDFVISRKQQLIPHYAPGE
jgi:DNA-binding transcriptional LysR family regulator